MEAIKLLTGLGKPLTGTLLTMDLGTMRFHRLKIDRRKDCPVCGDR
jgi:adenylyltransferase/sulfurtransferase